jgi:hypothetical protein
MQALRRDEIEIMCAEYAAHKARDREEEWRIILK